jgi:hypothetical protein
VLKPLAGPAGIRANHERPPGPPTNYAADLSTLTSVNLSVQVNQRGTPLAIVGDFWRRVDGAVPGCVSRPEHLQQGIPPVVFALRGGSAQGVAGGPGVALRPGEHGDKLGLCSYKRQIPVRTSRCGRSGLSSEFGAVEPALEYGQRAGSVVTRSLPIMRGAWAGSQMARGGLAAPRGTKAGTKPPSPSRPLARMRSPLL